MEILTLSEVRLRLEEICTKIKAGNIFIHPTDTIYGLGCNALNMKAVQKIRELKQRPETPFSIWVPSLEWVHQNCLINKEAEQWLQQLPGPYTLILKLKNKKAIAENVNSGLPAIGIRYPDHWFRKVVEKIGVPIITTSANKAGQKFMTAVEDLDPEILPYVEFMISEGEKKGHASKIIDLTTGKIKER